VRAATWLNFSCSGVRGQLNRAVSQSRLKAVPVARRVARENSADDASDGSEGMNAVKCALANSLHGTRAAAVPRFAERRAQWPDRARRDRSGSYLRVQRRFHGLPGDLSDRRVDAFDPLIGKFVARKRPAAGLRRCTDVLARDRLNKAYLFWAASGLVRSGRA
jgi:hypothetical protein